MNNPKHKNDVTGLHPQVRVVQASAGSGKTFALAKRYVQLLLSSEDATAMRAILAITFTNKAAFEMKARILEFLKKIAFGLLTDSERAILIAPLGLSDELIEKRSYAIMENIIRNYNFFQVQTIDSFINALLSGCSFKINLSANFIIRRNSREYIAASLDSLIERTYDEVQVRRAFQDYLHQYLFIENRSGWFPKKDLMVLMSAMFSKLNALEGGFISSDIRSPELFAQKKLILKAMKELREILPENTDARFVKTYEEFLRAHSDSFDIDHVSKYFARDQFPATKGMPVANEVERVWAVIHRGLKQLCEMESLALFNAYIDVFRLTMEELKKIAVKEDVLFLEELNKKARYLFDEGEVTVEELYYRLATRFHHYMIDEFQDTSRLQWGNLQMMVEEALSTGGSLFYVGDKKQAIYGFRGGDSSLFDDLKNHFARYVREEFLENNYRSRRNLVEFNNRVFSIENLTDGIARKENNDREKKRKSAVSFTPQDVEDIKDVFLHAQQTAREGFDGGYIKIERVLGEKKEERDEFLRQSIVRLVGQLKVRFSPGEIAILARNNSDIEMLTGWLLQEGIAVDSERTSNMLNNKIIKELIALLKFLDSPIDNVSFSEFILGDIFARVSQMKSALFHDFIFSLRSRVHAQNDFYIYKEFRLSFPQLWEVFFDRFFKNVGLYPLYEFTVDVFDRFQVHRNFPGDEGFVMHLLKVIKEREYEYGDLTAFLKYLEDPSTEDLFVHVPVRDAIKILTVHKAKGLEFSVVILSGLEMEMNVGSGGKDARQSFILCRDELNARLVRLKNEYRIFSPKLDELYQQEYKKSFLSELNNVYVALTRAVHEMYIYLPARAGNSINVAQFLIPEDCQVIGEPVAVLDVSGKKEPRAALTVNLSHDWMRFLNDEFETANEIDPELKKKGERIHTVLSFIKDLRHKNLDACLFQARSAFESDGILPQDWDAVEMYVRGIVESQSLKPIFYDATAQVLTEWEVVDASGNTLRMDRVHRYPDRVDIYDFKSSADQKSEHLRQVRNYLKIVGSIYPSCKVRGFLVYLDTRTVDAVDEGSRGK